MNSKYNTPTFPKNNKKITTHKCLIHDFLFFLSYFLNNFLFHCYFHVIFNTFVNFFQCVNFIYKSDLQFLSKFTELAVSYLIVYTWLYRFSNNFDGYAFHHIFYYKYGIINFREMLSRVFGTLASGAMFGWIYHRCFPATGNPYDIGLKRTLYNMLDSNFPLTMMDSFIYPRFKEAKRHDFFKRFLSPLMLNSLKYEDRHFELLEKYVGLLIECFSVEFTFSMFVYVMSSFLVKCKCSNKWNLAFSSFVRNAFVTCGNTYLSKVDGSITLDETKALIIFFKQRNVGMLTVRLLANMIGAVLVPVLVPMPKIMNLYDYKDLYPNTKLDNDIYISDLTQSYYIENKSKSSLYVYYTKWPNTRMGRFFSKMEIYLNDKLKQKRL